MVGVCIQHLLGLDCQSMGQFSVLLALCHRVLLISTFFPPPLRPSREVVLVTSLIVNNSFQWEQTGCPLYAPLQVHQCSSGTFREAGCSISSLLTCWRKSVKLCQWLLNDTMASTNKFVINWLIIIDYNVTVYYVTDWAIILTVIMENCLFKLNRALCHIFRLFILSSQSIYNKIKLRKAPNPVNSWCQLDN